MVRLSSCESTRSTVFADTFGAAGQGDGRVGEGDHRQDDAVATREQASSVSRREAPGAVAGRLAADQGFAGSSTMKRASSFDISRSHPTRVPIAEGGWMPRLPTTCLL